MGYQGKFSGEQIDERLTNAGDIPDMKSDIATLLSNVGKPDVITDASDFATADHSKVYAYMGETTASYTHEHWYYYKNNAWTDGGIWGSAVPIDGELETAGAAADAAATGAAIGELKSALADGFYSGHYIDGYTITLNNGIGNHVGSINPSANYGYFKIKCDDFEKIAIKGQALQIPRLWAFTDADSNILLTSGGSVDGNIATEEIIIEVPDGAVYVYGNAKTAEERYIHGIYGWNSDYSERTGLTEMERKTDGILSDAPYAVLDNYIDGYTINLNGGIGNPVGTINTSQNYGYFKIECSGFKQLLIKGQALQIQRLWAFTDADDKILLTSGGSVDGNLATDEITVDVPDGAVYVYGNAAKAQPRYVHGVYKWYTDLETKANGILKYPFTHIPEIKKVDALYHDITTWISYSSIISEYDALMAAHPDYITKEELGLDQSGTYTIYKYTFTPAMVSHNDFNAQYVKTHYSIDSYPIIYMQAAIHGIEYVNPIGVLELMAQITNAIDNDVFLWLKNNFVFVVIPVLNPYGYMNSLRGNVNGVDLNKNFPEYWDYGTSDTSSTRYRGAAPLSEKEAQYAYTTFSDLAATGRMLFGFDWHGHGAFENYKQMTTYLVGNYETQKLEKAGIAVVQDITASAHANHHLPLTSGFIGEVGYDINTDGGSFAVQAASLGVPLITPETLYRYYDGQTGSQWNTDTNSCRVEYAEFCLIETIRALTE